MATVAESPVTEGGGWNRSRGSPAEQRQDETQQGHSERARAKKSAVRRRGQEGSPRLEGTHEDLGPRLRMAAPTRPGGACKGWGGGWAALGSQAVNRPDATVHDNRPAWLADPPPRTLRDGPC